MVELKRKKMTIRQEEERGVDDLCGREVVCCGEGVAGRFRVTGQLPGEKEPGNFRARRDTRVKFTFYVTIFTAPSL